MPAEPPFHTYREQLWSLYRGLALWNPNHGELYHRVSIGDVGYVSEGAFIRMFNVGLPWDNESNRTFGIPDPYDPLDFGNLSIRRETFDEVDHYSRCVSRDENANNVQAASPDQADGVAYSCRGRGALLSLPHGGHREDAVQMKIFEKYIQDNVVNWFIWAQKKQLDVERMEDLILVSGCTLVTTWAAAVFTDHNMNAEVSLASKTDRSGRASFVWRNIRGPILHHNSRFDPQNSPRTPDQCVFIKGFRAKRVLFRIKPIRAAAEPLSDDPDDHRDGDIHVTAVPGVPKYHDPLIGVLDYIEEKCIEGAIAEDIMAIAHDDDLHFVEDMKTLTADEIEKHLHERNMPLLVENGAAILRAPRNNTSPVSKEKQVASRVAAESNGESTMPFRVSAPNYQLEQQDALTVDGVESFLRKNEIPVLPVVDKSVPLLWDKGEEVEPEEEHLTISSSSFYYPTASSFAGDPLPPLPEIRSEQIRKRIFTHSSCLPRIHSFQAPEDDPPVDNEEFGHLGDQVLALAIVDAIQERYPHLRVGPASKVRDRIKRKDILAEICKPYGLHMKLNLPERQACALRASQSVQGNATIAALAYVGGAYRDQGAGIASNWLVTLLRPHVEIAYRSVREDYFVPPDTEVPRQLETPGTTRGSSAFSSTSSEGASLALPSYLAWGPRDHRHFPTPSMTSGSSILSSTSSEDASPTLPSFLAGGPREHRHFPTPQANMRRRRWRRSSMTDDENEDLGLGSTNNGRKRLKEEEGTNDG